MGTRSEQHLGTCCICVPVRKGVLVIAFLTFVESFLAMLGLFTDDVRFLTGGYDITTRILSGVFGALGLVFSLAGMLGCYDSSASYVKVFWYFTVLRIMALVAIFGVDIVPLTRCESWKWKIQSITDYNPTMSAIARAGACETIRTAYTAFFFLDFFLSCYFSWTAWRFYSEVLYHGPNYLIRFEKESVPRLFSTKPVSYRPTTDPESRYAPRDLHHSSES